MQQTSAQLLECLLKAIVNLPPAQIEKVQAALTTRSGLLSKKKCRSNFTQLKKFVTTVSFYKPTIKANRTCLVGPIEFAFRIRSRGDKAAKCYLSHAPKCF